MILSDRFADVKKQVKKELDRYRYQHTLGVAYTAVCLAMRWGADMDDAFLAGLLHDCAKNIPDDSKVELAKRYKIRVTEVEKKAPSLLHAKLGAYLAEKKYGIKDPDVLNAIRSHTTGRPDMSLLEKILYTSDYIEPNRDRAPNLAEIRELAFTDLDRAVLRVAEDTLTYVTERHRNAVDPMTETVRDYYRKLNGMKDMEQNRKV